MKKYKFASAIVVALIGIGLLIAAIPVFKGEGGGILTFIYGIGIAAVPILVAGFLKNDKNNLPINKKLHIAFGIVGLVFQIIAHFVGGYFAVILSSLFAVLLLIMELTELKYQKGFIEKGFALLISISAILYASFYLIGSILGKFIPNDIERIIYMAVVSILPALLIAKGIVDIVRSFKPAKQVPTEEKAEEKPAE